MKQKISQAIIFELKVNNGRVFTKQKNLEKICLNFYKNLYQLKGVSEPTLRDVLEDLLVTFMTLMNETLSQNITKQ